MAGARARLIAFYLPQFYPIPENDEWWGTGFTEWTNVARARPLFPGHYQPHIPADLGFYDLRVPETRSAQAEMARQYGVEGFCYWHYWFAGKRLLQRPFDEVLRSGQPDFPFCLAWANQTWTGVWHGASERILLEQTYPGDDDHVAHFRSLLPAFSDPRYLKVDGKPVFVILEPIDLTERVVALWRDLARAAGLKGLFLVGNIGSADESAQVVRLGFDACTITRISGRATRRALHVRAMMRLLGHQRIASWHAMALRRPLHIYDYRKVRAFFDVPPDQPLEYYPCVVPNWDNTPRAGLRGYVFVNCLPDRFRSYLARAIRKVEPHDTDHRIVFLKSWNEWAEGNHLEPDLRFGKGHLEAIEQAVRGSAVETP